MNKITIYQYITNIKTSGISNITIVIQFSIYSIFLTLVLLFLSFKYITTEITLNIKLANNGKILIHIAITNSHPEADESTLDVLPYKNVLNIIIVHTANKQNAIVEIIISLFFDCNRSLLVILILFS